jgi:UDP-N-acetylmuramoylalanine--D-glutamate ligase
MGQSRAGRSRTSLPTALSVSEKGERRGAVAASARQRDAVLASMRGQRALLVGLGARTHVALARFMAQHGAAVTITDAKPADRLATEMALLGDLPVRYALGRHRVEDFIAADVVYVSPGVPADLPEIVAARRAGRPISSEMALFFALCAAPIVGITGSAGKTTTTSLVGAMLQAAGRRTWVGGNIGTPLIEHVLEIAPSDWVVLELSSFQLELLEQSPHVAAVLNITPNHLERHGTLAAYAEAKRNILRYQQPDDWAVLGYDNPITHAFGAACAGHVLYVSTQVPVGAGTFVRDGTLWLRWRGQETPIMRRDELQLPGEHNVANALAACAVAAACGVSTVAMAEVLRTFAGVEHRLETVRLWRGVRFVNDSIATAPERTVAALRSIDGPLILLVGGRLKQGVALHELAALARQRARLVVAFGEAGDVLAQALMAADGPSAVRRVADLRAAFDVAVAATQPGDVVLLSPAGTSFDAFRDFEERGRAFKALVAELEE